MKILVGILFCYAVANAQPDSVWSRTYGGQATEICNSLFQTDDGFVMAGYTGSFGSGSLDCWLVKTDENGDTIWTHTYGSTGAEYCFGADQCSDGGYIMAGSVFNGTTDFSVVRVNEDGDSLWSHSFGGTGVDICYSVKQTFDGGFVLAGRTNSFGSGQDDMWLLKTNTNGDSAWSRTYGGGTSEWCNAVIQTADSGYILVGRTNSFPGDFDSGWIVKTDANGDTLWTGFFDGNQDDEFLTVEQTDDGGYILGGRSRSQSHGEWDFWLMKLNSSGDSLWSRKFGGSEPDECYSVLQDVDGGYLMGGSTRSFGSGSYDFWLLKTDEDGDSLWSKTYGGAQPEDGFAMMQLDGENILLAGYTMSYGAGQEDYWLIKLGDATDAEDVPNVLPESFALSNYPNPFNATTTINYSLPRESRISLSLYDVLGREAAKLVSHEVETAGSHSIEFDGSNLTTGVYLVRLETEFGMRTSKAVLLK